MPQPNTPSTLSSTSGFAAAATPARPFAGPDERAAAYVSHPVMRQALAWTTEWLLTEFSVDTAASRS